MRKLSFIVPVAVVLIALFMSTVFIVDERNKALVLQLPPSLTFDEAKPRLDELFDILPEDFLYPIEGRHESWFTEEAVNYLQQKKQCLVWNFIEGINNPMPITTDYLYLRIIGDRSIPDNQFGKIRKDKSPFIKNLAQKLIKISEIPLAMVMTNNHFEGFGPATANTLGENLGMRELIWEEKKQKTLGNFKL